VICAVGELKVDNWELKGKRKKKKGGREKRSEK
jgi:hypothetical protein